MLFKKLNRVSSNGYLHHIPNFDKQFPELSKIGSEEMADRFRNLGVHFYTERKEPVNKLIRFTLPFAFIMIVLMYIGLPIWFVISGTWGYPMGQKNIILNWFNALRLSV